MEPVGASKVDTKGTCLGLRVRVMTTYEPAAFYRAVGSWMLPGWSLGASWMHSGCLLNACWMVLGCFLGSSWVDGLMDG